MTDTPQDKIFRNDVITHKMAVLRDDGVYRHLHFSKPTTRMMHFDVITYPGYLCYSGDMGCYVFSRVKDMFTFFRTDEGRSIDFNYWAEKLQAHDVNSGAREYSPEEFTEAVHSYMDDIEASDDLRTSVEDEVCYWSDDEHTARQAADKFEWEGKRVFVDFWEYNCQIFSLRFIWACRAIAWGIQQYDTKIVEDAAVHEAGKDA